MEKKVIKEMEKKNPSQSPEERKKIAKEKVVEQYKALKYKTIYLNYS